MSESTSANLTWHGALISRDKREQLLEQKGCVLWFTGLSGSGKSTVARALEQRIVSAQKQAYVLDGDNLRLGAAGSLFTFDFGNNDIVCFVTLVHDHCQKPNVNNPFPGIPFREPFQGTLFL